MFPNQWTCCLVPLPRSCLAPGRRRGRAPRAGDTGGEPGHTQEVSRGGGGGGGWPPSPFSPAPQSISDAFHHSSNKRGNSISSTVGPCEISFASPGQGALSLSASLPFTSGRSTPCWAPPSQTNRAHSRGPTMQTVVNPVSSSG